MDGALASRARRPRGARSGDLHDRLVMPSGRAARAYACAARRRRTHASLAAAFAAWRRTDSVCAGSGGTLGPAGAARRRLYPRAAGGRLCRARPPGWLESRRPVRLSRRARGDQSSGRRKLATASNCRSCKRSSTPANSSTIRRSPRFGRCSGVSPPKRRRRKQRTSRARRRLRHQAVGSRSSWNFRPSTTTRPGRRN